MCNVVMQKWRMEDAVEDLWRLLGDEVKGRG